jgi:hypothetical protein
MTKVNKTLPRPFHPGVSRPKLQKVELSTNALFWLRSIFFDSDGSLQNSILDDIDLSSRHGYINFSNASVSSGSTSFNGDMQGFPRCVDQPSCRSKHVFFLLRLKVGFVGDAAPINTNFAHPFPSPPHDRPCHAVDTNPSSLANWYQTTSSQQRPKIPWHLSYLLRFDCYY